jgi:hypothetical protein
LAELEDDDEMPEPDDDENDDDENEDDDDYEEVMVSRNLLSFMVHTHIISILSVNVMLRKSRIGRNDTDVLYMSCIILLLNFMGRQEARKRLQTVSIKTHMWSQTRVLECKSRGIIDM